MRTQTEGFDEPKNEWQPISQVVLSLPNLKECLEKFFWENDYNISVEEMDFEGKKTPIISIDWQNGDVFCDISEYNLDIWWDYLGQRDEIDPSTLSSSPTYKNSRSYKNWDEAVVLFFVDVEDNANSAYNIARRIMVRLRDAFNIALDQAVETKLIFVYGRRNNIDEPYKQIEPSKWRGVTIDDWMTGDAHLMGGISLFGLMAERGPNWPQENAPLKASDDEIIAFAKQVIADNGGDISQENGAIKLREKYPDLRKKKAMEIIKSLIGQQRPGRRSRRIN